MIKSIMAAVAVALSLLAQPAAAQLTGCQYTSGSFQLQKVRSSAAGSQIIGCINASLDLISASSASLSGSTVTASDFADIYVNRIGGRSTGTANIRISSPMYTTDGSPYLTWRGSATVEGSGGLGVTYGLAAGSATVTSFIRDNGYLIVAGSASVQGASGLGVTYGVTAGSGSFSSGVTASSGTLTATGATQYSLATSSGILMSGGLLQADGDGGANVKYGLVASTGYFRTSVAVATAAPAGNAVDVTGWINTTQGIKINHGSGDTTTCATSESLTGATWVGGIPRGGVCEAAGGTGDVITTATQTLSGENTVYKLIIPASATMTVTAANYTQTGSTIIINGHPIFDDGDYHVVYSTNWVQADNRNTFTFDVSNLTISSTSANKLLAGAKIKLEWTMVTTTVNTTLRMIWNNVRTGYKSMTYYHTTGAEGAEPATTRCQIMAQAKFNSPNKPMWGSYEISTSPNNSKDIIADGRHIIYDAADTHEAPHRSSCSIVLAAALQHVTIEISETTPTGRMVGNMRLLYKR